MTYIFSQACSEDAEQLVALINSAYRGETSKLGWTSEADLLDGHRTDIVDIQQHLQADDRRIFVCRDCSDILGSVLLQRQAGCVQISMLAVNPVNQGQGIGKRLINLSSI